MGQSANDSIGSTERDDAVVVARGPLRYTKLVILCGALIALVCAVALIPVLGSAVWFIAGPILLTTFILAITIVARGGVVPGLLILVISFMVAPAFVAYGPDISSLIGLSTLGSHKPDSTALDPEAASNAKEQAQRTVDALLDNDLKALTRFTYPKVLEMAGGAERMQKAIADGKKAMSTAGVSFEAVTLGEPSPPASYGGKTFTVIPQTVNMKTPKGTIAQDSYLLGISTDAGKNWTFVDGAGINDQTAKQVLPPLPSAIKLPTKSPPRMTPSPQS